MKVISEREVNLDELISKLDEKSQRHPVGMAGYDVMVEKQLLRDAHDVIVQFRNEHPIVIMEEDGVHLSYRE